MKAFNILVLKETREGEARVSLIPNDVSKLIELGHRINIESGAGKKAGHSDEDYVSAGALIRKADDDSLDSLFSEITLVIRVKRPIRHRETAELKSITPNTIMLGALDPLEAGSPHISEYKNAKIQAYSIDQIKMEPSDPMNILASMSDIAGRMALQDAIEKSKVKSVRNALIIGAGTASMAAIKEARSKGLDVRVILTSSNKSDLISNLGAMPILMSRKLNKSKQQAFIEMAAKDADVIVTAARRPKQKAPMLFPLSILDKMKDGACIVDLAISEGGNVEGSKHDTTVQLGNNVQVTNVSAYPKTMPSFASEKWSQASTAFVTLLSKSPDNPHILEARM